MPPKKPVTGATKAPAAKGGAAKPGAAKGGATSKTTPAKGGAAKGGATKAEPPKKEASPPAVVKKVLVPEEIGLKEIANVVNYSGAVGVKLQESKRWLYIIDRNGNVGTFLKYRDVNMIAVTSPPEFQPEPMRKGLMGSLCFGKPCIIDISDSDQDKIMGVVKDNYNKIYDGLYEDIMDRSIMDEQKCGKLYNDSDPDEYKNPYNYRFTDFKFIILTNVDPPSTVMEDFFPVIVT